jgi:succinate-semialdehyde dehydrogenase/glutarate-semialdehyde dehydrogenase
MRKAADLLRSRADAIARLMTQEQGKPLVEAKMETLAAADLIDWFAEEARRAYGRVIPARAEGVYQLVIRSRSGRWPPSRRGTSRSTKWSASSRPPVATGCSIIVKAPEETPASPAELVRAFLDAGVPGDVFASSTACRRRSALPHPAPDHPQGDRSPGSTPVGKQLAALAGAHMKRVTMELGGHAPAIVFDDADLDLAAKTLAGAKFRNAGQVCVSPTRFLVQEKLYEPVRGEVRRRGEAGEGRQRHGGGHADGPPRPRAPHPLGGGLVADARQRGAEVQTGGERIGNKGYFYEPTVLTGVGPRRAHDERGALRPRRHDRALPRASTRWWRRRTACPTASPPTPSPAPPRRRTRWRPRSRAG